MNPDQVPFVPSLGKLENVFTALQKLKQFNDSGEWQKHFGQYFQRRA